jgi:glycosyltransferase involved in cell wall biosynthesis
MNQIEIATHSPVISKQLDLTIVMPCLNEAETIGTCIKKGLKSLADLELSGEVLVADNGSTDGSIEIAKNLGARVVNIPRKGYGNALRGGIEAARGRWIIMGDSDDSYDFSALGPFVERFRQGAELVMGCRMPYGGGRIMPGAMPWKHRWIGNPALSFIGRWFFRCPVTDFHCGLRGFTREAFEKMQLKTTGMELASEMVIKATLRKLKIAEVPITLYKDGRSRPPHLRSWRDGWRHLRFMLLFSPRWLFAWPGLLMLLIGLIAGIPLCLGPVKIGRVQFDTNTLLVAGMMVVVGFQVMFFGVFTKLYCVARGFLPENKRLAAWWRVFSLEKGIALGVIVAVIGLGFLIAAVLKWKAAGFGVISYPDSLRLVIPAVTCLTLGVQTIFFSFFLSILELQHD